VCMFFVGEKDYSISSRPIIYMDIKICIIYKEGDRACRDFLAIYNKHVLPKVRKYRVSVPVISSLSLSPGQRKLLGSHVSRGIFPFAYVGNGKINEIYTNMDQVIDILILKIKASKSDADRGTYVNRVNDDSLDFLEMERRRPDLVAESDVGNDMVMFNDMDAQTSKIIAREVPNKRSEKGLMTSYAAGTGADFATKDLDPLEKSFVKDQIDAAQHDVDRFIFETFKDTAYDPEYGGSEDRVASEGVPDRLSSRLSDIINRV
jgi:hypothetical protein